MNLFLRINKERFVELEVIKPRGDWFTETHMQEILAAFAENFNKLIQQKSPTIIRTARVTFAIMHEKRANRIYCFFPKNSFEAISSIPQKFIVRVLGRGDIGESIPDVSELDSVMRLKSH